MKFENNQEFAAGLDREDTLAKYRNQFLFPRHQGKEVIYFTGNSLGLQPKTAKNYVSEILESWQERGVDGFFEGEQPWWTYQDQIIPPLGRLVGALPEEVTIMNTLTVNLHLLMVSFYRPRGKRYKILCEEKAFPSDQYMLKSQLRFHGFNPKDALIEVSKPEGSECWTTQDFLNAINQNADEIALILLGGVNYYNGQVLDMEAITKAGKQAGCMVGWDLAHAVGNVALKLHDWDVDFAAWCSYKYLNAGPGGIAGAFVHQRHLTQEGIIRFEGWWGNRKESRFLMRPDFEPSHSADAWQLSTQSPLLLAPLWASIKLFDEVGLSALIAKRDRLTAYLDFILQTIATETGRYFEIITPKDRGCQLSVLLHGEGRPLFDYLLQHGVLADWREPNVIRLAPAPFYSSFADMYRFGELLKSGLKS
jgi:kynureninase